MEKIKLYEPRISHKALKKFFEDALQQMQSSDDIVRVTREADSLQFSDCRLEVYKAAFFYLAAAEYLADCSTFAHLDAGQCSRIYHYAGHLMRVLGQWNQAGRAYANAGAFGEVYATKGAMEKEEKIEGQGFAVRSFANSKVCFAVVGNSDESDDMYVKEQKARQKLARFKKQKVTRFSLGFWRLSSRFGTSLRTLAAWILGIIGAYAAAYELLYQTGQIGSNGPAWSNILSAIYFSLVTISTLGYGDFYPCSKWAQLVVMSNIILGYLSLGVVVVVITRKIRGRQ